MGSVKDSRKKADRLRDRYKQRERGRGRIERGELIYVKYYILYIYII